MSGARWKNPVPARTPALCVKFSPSAKNSSQGTFRLRRKPSTPALSLNLKQAHRGESVLAIGAKAPAFELRDHTGNPVSSAELLSPGRLVICFFRGRWCPFCVGQLEAMNLILPRIEQAGAALLAISPQTVQQSFFMADQHKLRFPLLSDAGNNVARQFGLVYRVPDEQQAIYRRAFVNLPFANGDDSWELPIPATFILERDGTVLYASASEDYTDRPEPAEALLRLLQPRS